MKPIHHWNGLRPNFTPLTNQFNGHARRMTFCGPNRFQCFTIKGQARFIRVRVPTGHAPENIENLESAHGVARLFASPVAGQHNKRRPTCLRQPCSQDILWVAIGFFIKLIHRS
jgi:hypothetical protein